jgi:AraC-like DNA-binding protein
MIGCGTSTFTDPRDFRSPGIGLDVAFALTAAESFRVHLVWASLPSTHMLVIEERTPRIAFLSLPPGKACLSFPLRSDPASFWNGVRLRRGALALHASGDRFHHRTTGFARWGMIVMAAGQFANLGAALLGADVTLPARSSILCLPRAIASDFLRLYAQAFRLVEDRPDLFAHREVARALEQDLVRALVCGLQVAVKPAGSANPRQAEMMARFEDVLVRAPGQPPSMAELCRGVGVSPRTLRRSSAAILGCSPTEYLRLKRGANPAETISAENA